MAAAPSVQTPGGAVCRTGPDGGPPAGQPAGRLEADRGIGGTGKPVLAATSVQTADRGIGGTGIVGVVTGFASICVDGIEVAYDDTAKVDIDGAAADPSRLRVGEVVAVNASGSVTQPRARSISVRIEATGRIDSLSMTSGALRVGGQMVLVATGVPGADRFTLGDWVSVSGLRRPDGVIVASRLDSAPANALSVRGQVGSDGNALLVGTLTLPAGKAKPGDWVHVTGSYADGKPLVSAVVADTLCPNPSLCFAGMLDHIVVQAYVRTEGDRVHLGGMLLPVRGTPGQPGTDGAAIVSLERNPDGSYTAVDVRSVESVMKRTFLVPQPLVPDQPTEVTRPARPTAPRERTASVSKSRADGGEFPSSIASLTTPPGDLDAGPGAAGMPPNASMVSTPVDISVPLPVITQSATATASLPGPAPGGSGSGASGSGASGSGGSESSPSGAGSGGGDVNPGPSISGSTASGAAAAIAQPAPPSDISVPISQPIQLPGSPLPASGNLGGAGVPISSNAPPAQFRGLNIPGGIAQQTILSTGALTGAQAAGVRVGVPSGAMTPAITTLTPPTSVVNVTPTLPAANAGAAGAAATRSVPRQFAPSRPHTNFASPGGH